ncbi:UNVERIFIED_ORG: hypothetical protein ABIC81_001302 [Bacillus proteolyticus]
MLCTKNVGIFYSYVFYKLINSFTITILLIPQFRLFALKILQYPYSPFLLNQEHVYNLKLILYNPIYILLLSLYYVYDPQNTILKVVKGSILQTILLATMKASFHFHPVAFFGPTRICHWYSR